jgi:hypothetical protein
MEFVSLAIYHDGMPGIGAALIPHYDIGVFGEKIGDFRLSFISELRAYHNNVRQDSRLFDFLTVHNKNPLRRAI